LLPPSWLFAVRAPERNESSTVLVLALFRPQVFGLGFLTASVRGNLINAAPSPGIMPCAFSGLRIRQVPLNLLKSCSFSSESTPNHTLVSLTFSYHFVGVFQTGQNAGVASLNRNRPTAATSIHQTL